MPLDRKTVADGIGSHIDTIRYVQHREPTPAEKEEWRKLHERCARNVEKRQKNKRRR